MTLSALIKSFALTPNFFKPQNLLPHHDLIIYSGFFFHHFGKTALLAFFLIAQSSRMFLVHRLLAHPLLLRAYNIWSCCFLHWPCPPARPRPFMLCMHSTGPGQAPFFSPHSLPPGLICSIVSALTCVQESLTLVVSGLQVGSSWKEVQCILVHHSFCPVLNTNTFQWYAQLFATHLHVAFRGI